MDFANSKLDNDETAANHHRKYLSLEARHSKAVETVRKLRSNLTASIFIPKKTVKSQNSPRTPSTTSPKISPQQGGTSPAKPNAEKPNLLKPKPDLKRKLECNQTKQKAALPSKISTLKQYRELLLDRNNVIRAKLWSPPQNSKSNDVLSDRSIEDELKSMGLEVSSDTEYFENSPATQQEMPSKNRSSTDEIVKSLSLGERKEQPKDADVLKSTEIPKHIQGHQIKKPISKPSKKQSKVMKKRNHSEIPTRNRGSTKFTEDNHECQSYNDSLHGVKEFQNILQTILRTSNTSKTDREINRSLLDLQNSIDKFSAFLFETYRNLDLLEVLPSRLNRNLYTTNPTKVTQPATKFVVRIDVPNILEQVITFNTTEILQHTINNYENGNRLRQEEESNKKVIVDKSSKSNIENHLESIEQPDSRNQTSVQRKTPREQIQEPPMPHPAFRNQSVQAEQRANHTEERTETTTLFPAYINQYTVADHHRVHTQETQKESALIPACRNNSPSAGQCDPLTEPTIHPAFRNPTAQAESKGSPSQHCIMPQQDRMDASNSNTPSSPSSNPSNANVQYPPNTKHPQTSTSDQNYSPHSANILRPSVIYQPPPFNIPYPVAPQITPTDPREFLAAHHSPNSNPLLTPPQSTDCQSSAVFRPLPLYLYQGYKQTATVPMTPPSEDIRFEATHQYQLPPTNCPSALGIHNQDRWPYIYKDMEVSPCMPYFKSALSAPPPYPQEF